MSCEMMLTLLAEVILWVIFASRGEAACKHTYAFRPMTTGGTKSRVKTIEGIDKIQRCVDDLNNKYDPDLDFISLDEFAKKYAECVVDGNLGTFDKLNLSHTEGPIKRLKAWLGPIEYHTEVVSLKTPDVLMEKWLTNRMKNGTIDSEITQAATRTTSQTIGVSKGFNVGASVEMETSVFFASASLSVETSLEVDKEDTKSTSKGKTVTVTGKVSVPPQTRVKVIWTVTDSSVDLQWRANLNIQGWIPVQTTGDSNYWFLPIGDMACVFPKFFTRTRSDILTNMVKGVFSKVATLDSQLDTIEYGLTERCTDKPINESDEFKR